MKMKNMVWAVVAACGMFVACAGNDDDLGPILPMSQEYELPQGKSPADDRIVAFYENYGSYILYEYGYLDFMRDLPATTYVYELPDPQYVGEMLDFLQDVWFGFYSDEFNKEFIPYKLFLTQRLVNGVNGADMPILTSKNAIRLNYCSDTLSTFSPADKLSIKNTLQILLWGNLWSDEVDVPDDFFAVSDYSIMATSETEARMKGFIADRGNEWSVDYGGGWDDWSFFAAASRSGALDSMTDLKTYLYAFVSRTSAEWEADLRYPLVKQKYDILRNFFLDEYSFDIQKVGDATFE